ncbi:nucleoside triphosphate pyrophosphohydrolase [Armatimonas rosea]|uniref:Tetrapyrrole methylase family protein/MazG family protein n=1 Tax=Armatimonas rosea TaxID=685828 RepID=A0A7W9SL29_ARMRO|nr:nucleoside triphosphate pyrophosphohydrolase [Armatimonas rosea]MBB6048310.1 tetrapyrrole methylase family protein/MazG family protein [Armatimonas rosea]
MLYLVGLGPGSAEALPPRAFSLLTGGLPVLVRTERHPVLHSEPLASALAGCDVTPLDDEYEAGASFSDTYDAIVARVLRAHAAQGSLVYAVPGHPLVGETTIARLLAETKRLGVETQVIGAPSFVDACLEAIGEAVTGDLHVIDALLLDPEAAAPPAALRTGGPLLLYQVHSQAAASNAKLALSRAGYPDEFLVTVVHGGGIPGLEQTATLPLYELDRSAHRKLIDHLTTVWVPELPADQRRADFDTLLEVVARLRDPEGGCPWDLKQTHTSLRRYVIEEAYEVAEAIDQEDLEALCEELGDLLLQVVLHAQIARESADFDALDICAVLCEKLIRRHPHVFGDASARDSDAVLAQWNAIKAQEKQEKGKAPKLPSVLDGIPTSLPALSQALETSKRVVKVGFEWPDVDQVFVKVEEELAELRAELAAGRTQGISDELGDVLFTLVNVGRKMGVDAEEALRVGVSRFSGRWRFIEEAAHAQGRSVSELTLAEQAALWQAAKRAQRGE